MPQRFDFDIKKLFYEVDPHWKDFHAIKKAQALHSGAFDPLDEQNFTYTYDTNDDFEQLNRPQQDENVFGDDD